MSVSRFLKRYRASGSLHDAPRSDVAENYLSNEDSETSQRDTGIKGEVLDDQQINITR